MKTTLVIRPSSVLLYLSKMTTVISSLMELNHIILFHTLSVFIKRLLKNFQLKWRTTIYGHRTRIILSILRVVYETNNLVTTHLRHCFHMVTGHMYWDFRFLHCVKSNLPILKHSSQSTSQTLSMLDTTSLELLILFQFLVISSHLMKVVLESSSNCRR